MTTTIPTSNITIENIGTFEVPTARLHEIVSWAQNAQQQLREITSNKPENDGRTLING